jgi:hypothetical protein
MGIITNDVLPALPEIEPLFRVGLGGVGPDVATAELAMAKDRLGHSTDQPRSATRRQRSMSLSSRVASLLKHAKRPHQVNWWRLQPQPIYSSGLPK